MHRVVGLAMLVGCEGSPMFQEIVVGDGDAFERVFQADWTPPFVEVVLATEHVNALRLEPREWVPATVGIEDDVLKAEVRLKGHGSFQPIDARPSLKIKFEEDWYGYDKLVFNNYTSDPSLLHERLATTAFHMLDLPAARAGHAGVIINGEFLGVYGVLEDVDPDMLRRWFPDEDGSLYELFDGDFQPGLLEGLEHEEGPPADALIEHITADLATGDAIGFDLAIEHFDREQFLTFWATTAVVGQTDAFPYSDPGDDVYLYLDPATERFHFIPHGLDEAFMPRRRTINRTNGLLARRCLNNPACQRDFIDEVRRVFAVLEDEGFMDEVYELVDQSLRLWHPAKLAAAMDPHHLILEDWLERRRGQLSRELEQ